MLVQANYLQQNLSTKKYTFYKIKNTSKKIKQKYYCNFSNPYLPNLPIESHTLNTLTAHTKTSQVTVIKKLID